MKSWLLGTRYISLWDPVVKNITTKLDRGVSRDDEKMFPNHQFEKRWKRRTSTGAVTNFLHGTTNATKKKTKPPWNRGGATYIIALEIAVPKPDLGAKTKKKTTWTHFAKGRVEENHHRMPVPNWWKPYRQSITATLMQPPHYDSHITQAAAAAKNFHASSRSLPNATCRNWVAKTQEKNYAATATAAPKLDGSRRQGEKKKWHIFHDEFWKEIVTTKITLAQLVHKRFSTPSGKNRITHAAAPARNLCRSHATAICKVWVAKHNKIATRYSRTTSLDAGNPMHKASRQLLTSIAQHREKITKITWKPRVPMPARFEDSAKERRRLHPSRKRGNISPRRIRVPEKLECLVLTFTVRTWCSNSNTGCQQRLAKHCKIAIHWCRASTSTPWSANSSAKTIPTAAN